MTLSEKGILTKEIFHVMQEKADMLFPPSEVSSLILFICLVIYAILFNVTGKNFFLQIGRTPHKIYSQLKDMKTEQVRIYFGFSTSDSFQFL